jgi:Beta-eliminating lyase
MQNMTNYRRQHKRHGPKTAEKGWVPQFEWIMRRARVQCGHVGAKHGRHIDLPSPVWISRGPASTNVSGFGKMNFASDNAAPVAPDILDAILEANCGFARGYGNDDWTQSVERRLSEIFERDVAAFLVPTGTAANALALAQVSPPWGVVLCHNASHIATDECGAPEFFGHGLRLEGLPGEGGKITAELLQAAPAATARIRWFRRRCRFTQASEAGTIYRTDEIATLAELAYRRSLAVHMDGARFANALVRLNATPAEMTWRSGVDVLSPGATKGGALAAEAVGFSLTLRRFLASAASVAGTFFRSIALSPRSCWLSWRQSLARAGASRQCHGRQVGGGTRWRRP